MIGFEKLEEIERRAAGMEAAMERIETGIRVLNADRGELDGMLEELNRKVNEILEFMEGMSEGARKMQSMFGGLVPHAPRIGPG